MADTTKKSGEGQIVPPGWGVERLPDGSERLIPITSFIDLNTNKVIAPPDALAKVMRQMDLQFRIGGPVCVQHAWYTSPVDWHLALANHGGGATKATPQEFTLETDWGEVTLRPSDRLEVGEIVSLDHPEE